jgi:hypothetical protein
MVIVGQKGTTKCQALSEEKLQGISVGPDTFTMKFPQMPFWRRHGFKFKVSSLLWS